jgi:deoxycytidylate deaminase
MSTAEALPIKVMPPQQDGKSKLRDRIASYLSQEIVIGVVGYAGSGNSYVAGLFENILRDNGFDVHTIKARTILESWAEQKKQTSPSTIQDIKERVKEYQNLGDDLRKSSGEYGAVAGMMAMRVHEFRGQKEPDQLQVFLLDSLKHPAEVELLRQIYGEGFRLVGVGCRPNVRETRLGVKFHTTADDEAIQTLVSRDAEDSINKYGQQVNKTFHLADYFVNNTVSAEQAEQFTLPDELKHLFEKLFTRITHHPKRDEKGLYFADAAALSSACLSRQVGAAIMDKEGNLLATGRNDVPKPGGGLYEEEHIEVPNGLCHVRGHCSNKKEQSAIANEILQIFQQEGMPSIEGKEETVRAALAGTRMGSLIEFSRSIHAEMDALISLSRTGTRLPPNSTLYTTTYPCHNCARHIVAAGISRVVYLEPYKKSLAIELHNDAIADNEPEQNVNNRVKFEPYVGVAPRLYQTIYKQHGERKDDDGKALPEELGRNLRSRLVEKTFSDLENECTTFFSEGDDDA